MVNAYNPATTIYAAPFDILLWSLFPSFFFELYVTGLQLPSQSWAFRHYLKFYTSYLQSGKMTIPMINEVK